VPEQQPVIYKPAIGADFKAPVKARTRYRSNKIRWSNYESELEASAALFRGTAWQSGDTAALSLATRNNTDCTNQSHLLDPQLDIPNRCVLSIKAYASDRLVLTSADAAPPMHRLPTRLAKVRQDNARVLRLDNPRESQQNREASPDGRCIPRATRFTQYGKGFVADSIHLIEHEKEGKAVFLTLTFPGRSRDALDVYSAYSGWLVNRFNQWLRRRCARGLFAYVWELTKLGAPHLHYVFKIVGTGEIDRISLDCQNHWRTILLDLCEKTSLDLFEREGRGSWIGDRRTPFVTARLVRTGLAKYLSKYLSKGVGGGGKKFAWHPGRWWRVSQPLKALVLKSRLFCKLRFGDREAGDGVVLSILAATPGLLTGEFRVDRVKTHGALCVCLSTPAGASVKIASALKVWLSDGDFTALAEIIRKYETPVRTLSRGGFENDSS
jgi:hypothetical protein